MVSPTFTKQDNLVRKKPHPEVFESTLYALDVPSWASPDDLCAFVSSSGFSFVDGDAVFKSFHPHSHVFTITFWNVYHAEKALVLLQGSLVTSTSPPFILKISARPLHSSTTPEGAFPRYLKPLAPGARIYASLWELFDIARIYGPLAYAKEDVHVGSMEDACVLGFWTESDAIRAEAGIFSVGGVKVELKAYNPRNLYCTNLAASCEVSDLYEAFGVFGEVVSATIINRGKSRTYGFVAFGSDDDAACARAAMDGSWMISSVIQVRYQEGKNLRPVVPAAHGAGAHLNDDDGFVPVAATRAARRRAAKDRAAQARAAQETEEREAELQRAAAEKETRKKKVAEDAERQRKADLAESCRRMAELHRREEQERRARKAARARQAEVARSKRKLQDMLAQEAAWKRAQAEAEALRHEQESAEEKAVRERERARKAQEEAEASERRARAEKAEAEATRKCQERETAAACERERCLQRDRSEWGSWWFAEWTPAKALARFGAVSEEFERIRFSDAQPLCFESVPWPVLKSPFELAVDDVDWGTVEEFFAEAETLLSSADYKSLLDKAHKRFHPDKWRAKGRLATVAEEVLRGQLENAVNLVSQALTPIWAESRRRC